MHYALKIFHFKIISKLFNLNNLLASEEKIFEEIFDAQIQSFLAFSNLQYIRCFTCIKKLVIKGVTQRNLGNNKL